jgi:hypothetical protein
VGNLPTRSTFVIAQLRTLRAESFPHASEATAGAGGRRRARGGGLGGSPTLATTAPRSGLLGGGGSHCFLGGCRREGALAIVTA